MRIKKGFFKLNFLYFIKIFLSDLTEVVRNLQDNGYILGVNIDGPYIGDNEPTVDAKNCRITLKGLQYLEYLKKEKS